MKNTRVKVRLKNDAVAEATIKDSVLIAGETSYLCEFIDAVDKSKVLLIVHCSDIMEIMQ